MVKTRYRVRLCDEEGQEKVKREFNFGVFKSNGIFTNNSCEGTLGQEYLRKLAEILPNAEVKIANNEFSDHVVKENGEKMQIKDLLEVKDKWIKLIQDTLPKLEANKVEKRQTGSKRRR